MDKFITSLDNPDKRLEIYSGHGSTTGDLVLSTAWFEGSQLIAAGIGTGNYRYVCPLFKAARDVQSLFVKNKEHLLQGKKSIPADYSFSEKNIITYGVADHYSSQYQKLDFIMTDSGFFGIRTRTDLQRQKDKEELVQNTDNLVWLSGPDDPVYANIFGKAAYNRRRKIFGQLYETALAEPPQMGNPIYAGSAWRELITKQGKSYQHPTKVAHQEFADQYDVSEATIIHSITDSRDVLFIRYLEGNGDLAVGTVSINPDNRSVDDQVIRVSQQARSAHGKAIYAVFADAESTLSKPLKSLIDASTLNPATQTIAQIDEPVADQAYMRVYRDNSGLIGIKIGHTNPKSDKDCNTPIVWTNDPVFEPLLDAVQTAHKNLYNL